MGESQCCPTIWTGWVSLIGDLIWSFASDNAEGDDKARAVRRLIPFNNLVWWDGLVDQMQRSAGKALED